MLLLYFQSSLSSSRNDNVPSITLLSFFLKAKSIAGNDHSETRNKLMTGGGDEV